MAAVWIWRAAVVLYPLTVAGWRMVQGPGLSTTLRISEKAKKLLADANSSDDVLSELLSRENGYPVRVTTITGDFECRRVQLEFSVSGTSLLDEDVRVITFHHIKLSGGAPISTWDQADFDLLVNAYLAWWTSLKVWYHANFVLTSIKFYKAGPAIVPPQPPVFESVQNVAGTSNNASLPPQVALSVTEIAGQKRNWGRFYMPAPCQANSSSVGSLTQAGRPETIFMQGVADVTDTLYETALTANKPFVVYRPTLAANRPTGNPPTASTLPERPANAQTVEQIQVDDVYDVIRRRRWENATLRIQRAIGSAQAFQVSAGGNASALQQSQDSYGDEPVWIPPTEDEPST